MTATRPRKYCEICDKTVRYKGWSDHCKGKKHMRLAKEEQEIIDNSKAIINDKDELVRMKDLEIKLLKEQIESLRKANEKLKTTSTVNNNNTNITIQNFEQETVMLNDNFLHQLEHPELSIQNRRLMLENYISDESPTIAKTNMRDRLMYYSQNGRYKIAPQEEIIKKRINGLPQTYRRSICYTVNNWDDPYVTKEDKTSKIKLHYEFANQLEHHKYTKQDNEDLQRIVKCNAYNNKIM